MLRFGDDLKEWMLVARTSLRQVPTEQRWCTSVLETDLRLHVDAQLDADTPNVEATFEAIGMAFEAVQPIIGNDHSGCLSLLLN